MKKNFLLQKNEHKDRKMNRHKFFVITIIFVVIICLISYFVINLNKKKLNREFEEYVASMTFAEDKYEEEMFVLDMYLEESGLSNVNRGNAYNLLSIVTALTNNMQDSIAYMCKSLYFFEKENENTSLVNVSVNLSATLLNTTAYDMVDSILQKALDIPLDEEQARIAHAYIYTNLAENASQAGHYDQALEFIELGESKIQPEDDLEDCEMSMQISKAKAYFGLGRYEECRQILDSVDKECVQENLVAVVGYAIPYFEVSSYMELRDGNIEKAKEYFQIYVDYCDTYSYSLLKLTFIDEFILVAEEFGRNHESFIKEMEDNLLVYYREELSRNNESRAQILLDTYNTSMQNVSMQSERNDRTVKIYFWIVGTCIIISIIGSMLLSTYKRSQMDFLTGGYNRLKLRSVYRSLLKKKQPFYVIMFDIDNFKQCNDKYGHPFGDLVLERISRTVMDGLPKMSMFFRYGGEEFVVLCDLKTKEEVLELAEQIRRSVEKLIWENGTHITISIGVSGSLVSQEPLRSADECLYTSKKTGKNKVTHILNKE